jgi:flavin-dependent dehydrogenase
VTRQRLDVGPLVLDGSPPPSAGVAEAYAPRRTVLDKILLDAAAAAGVEVRERFVVDELIWDGDRVSGIRGHEVGGATTTEHARIVIGADGIRSMVARNAEAPTYDVRPVYACAYYTYWDDLPLKSAELYIRPERFMVAGPTNNGQTLVISYWPIGEFQKVRSDIEGHFMDALDLAPNLAERARAGKRAERFRGTADLQNFYRRPYGPGWALVGDAGYHKDPITAQGITDAFRDAELLATAIHAGFSSQVPITEALAEYEQQRNQATRAMYDMTCQFASLEPPAPEMQQLMGALLTNQTDTNNFFGAIDGTVPIPEFFAPENLGRIIGAAQARAA